MTVAPNENHTADTTARSLTMILLDIADSGPESHREARDIRHVQENSQIV